MYKCIKIEYTKYKNKKCKLEKQLEDITQEIKKAKNKMFIYNFNHYFIKSLQI